MSMSIWNPIMTWFRIFCPRQLQEFLLFEMLPTLSRLQSRQHHNRYLNEFSRKISKLVTRNFMTVLRT